MPLQQTAQAWHCENNHSFDIAKEGYVNLLPVQHKNSLEPGDDKSMLLARRAFLDAGHYQPLAAYLQGRVKAFLQKRKDQQQPLRILDIGSGEGYYLGKIAEVLPEGVDIYGFDIAKFGVKKGAKKCPQARWAVASAYAMPYEDHSFDLVTRIYAPSDAAEVWRCLQPEGVLFTVTPAPNHLLELKQQLYTQVTHHTEQVQNYAGFVHQHRERLSYTLTLTAQDSVQLVQMTPFAWRAKESEPATTHLDCNTLQQVQSDFYVDSYQRLADFKG